MRIVESYSHLNGEEYLIARQPKLYDEIKNVIANVDCTGCVTKVSKEKTMLGKKLMSPPALNKLFNTEFRKVGWFESRYRYYITTNRKHMEELLRLELKEQREYLKKAGVDDPLISHK